jgi:hypothetical protein
MPYAGLTERTLRYQSGMFERKVWSLAPAAGCPTAAILFLDAELYLERVGAGAVVRRLQEGGAPPPPTAVFLSHGGAAVSHEDSSAAPKYARFVARDLVGSVRRSTRRDRDRDRRLSLSGLAGGVRGDPPPGRLPGGGMPVAVALGGSGGDSPRSCRRRRRPRRSSGSAWSAGRPRPGRRTRRPGCGKG